MEIRINDNTELNDQIQNITEHITEMQSDLQRKINHCNDYVVHSGLQSEYNASRQQLFSSTLDEILGQSCLEVGQTKLFKAVTLRLCEIENKLMQL